MSHVWKYFLLGSAQNFGHLLVMIFDWLFGLITDIVIEKIYVKALIFK